MSLLTNDQIMKRVISCLGELDHKKHPHTIQTIADLITSHQLLEEHVTYCQTVGTNLVLQVRDLQQKITTHE